MGGAQLSGQASELSPAAKRMADTRLRRKYGFRCLTIEIHKDEIAALISAGYLDPAERGDKHAVAGALAEFHELFFEQPKVIEILRRLRQATVIADGDHIMPTQDHFDDTGDPRSWGAVPVKADPPVKFDDLPDAPWLDYQRPRTGRGNLRRPL